MDTKFKKRLREAQPVVGPWVSISNPTNLEIMARTGADFLLIDGEHSAIHVDALAHLLPSVAAAAIPVVYRVRTDDTANIKAALDAGISALMVPMVETAEQAERVIQAAKYPPRGRRGIGPWRASQFYEDFDRYLAEANAQTTTILQIETQLGLDNVDAIAAVEGVDILYVGPADLSAALGLPVGVLGPDLLAACRRVAVAATRAGKIAGIDLATTDYLEPLQSCGFSFFSYGSDIGFLQSGARGALAAFREISARNQDSSPTRR